jgi:hypothetical protein
MKSERNKNYSLWNQWTPKEKWSGTSIFDKTFVHPDVGGYALINYTNPEVVKVEYWSVEVLNYFSPRLVLTFEKTYAEPEELHKINTASLLFSDGDGTGTMNFKFFSGDAYQSTQLGTSTGNAKVEIYENSYPFGTDVLTNMNFYCMGDYIKSAEFDKVVKPVSRPNIGANIHVVDKIFSDVKNYHKVVEIGKGYLGMGPEINPLVKNAKKSSNAKKVRENKEEEN